MRLRCASVPGSEPPGNPVRERRDRRYDMVIFTTGAGTQYLLSVLAASGPVEPFLQALKKVQIVARGPKPVAALSESGVRVSVSVPESYTWREVLDATAALKCSSVAVQDTDPEPRTGPCVAAARFDRHADYNLPLGFSRGSSAPRGCGSPDMRSLVPRRDLSVLSAIHQPSAHCGACSSA